MAYEGMKVSHALFRSAALALVFACSMGVDVTGARAGERPSVDGWPTFAVGKVNVRGGGFCTATLIADDQALTAAHCLRDRGGRWLKPNRPMVEFAPYRDSRKGYAAVLGVVAAPGLAFSADGAAVNPARDWAVLELGKEGLRDRRVQPVTLASFSEREALNETSVLTLVAYTPERPFVATIAEGCKVEQMRGEPRLLLHDCVQPPL